MVQLAVTFGIVCIFTLSQDVKDFLYVNTWMVWVALVGTLICVIALSCSENLRRKTPHNYIFLAIFTVCY